MNELLSNALAFGADPIYKFLIIFTKYFCTLDHFSTQGENSVHLWTGKSEGRITPRVELSDSDKHSSLLHKVVNQTCALYYKHITIVNDDSRVVNKLETSLTNDARVTNYNVYSTGHRHVNRQ
jgi:hypothetical protein